MLVIVGSDPERPYRSTVEGFARQHQVSDRVVLTGHLEGQAKADAYAAATVMVLPSKSENFGNVVLEAMSAGVPVIVTRGVGLAAEVEASGAGIVVEHTTASLSSALRRVLADSAECSRLSERARPFVADRFDWLEIAKRWSTHYARLVAQNHSANA